MALNHYLCGVRQIYVRSGLYAGRPTLCFVAIDCHRAMSPALSARRSYYSIRSRAFLNTQKNKESEKRGARPTAITVKVCNVCSTATGLVVIACSGALRTQQTGRVVVVHHLDQSGSFAGLRPPNPCAKKGVAEMVNLSAGAWSE